MRSIKARFKKAQNSQPSFGDFPNLSQAVYKQSFSRPSLCNALRRLVDPVEYDQSDFSKLVDHLEKSTNTTEEPDFKAKIAMGEL